MVTRGDTKKDSAVDKIKDHAGDRKDHADRSGCESGEMRMYAWWQQGVWGIVAEI